MKYNPDLDVEIQIEQLEASIPLIHTGEDQIGWMRPEIWEDIFNIFMERGLINEEYDVREIYSMEFLEQVYGGEP